MRVCLVPQEAVKRASKVALPFCISILVCCCCFFVLHLYMPNEVAKPKNIGKMCHVKRGVFLNVIRWDKIFSLSN